MIQLIYLAGVLAASAQAIAFCPTGCTCNDETLVVQCEKSKLDVLPITLNPSIQRLVLRNNKIKTVDSAFQFYGELQYVDLSYNHMVSIPTKSFDNQKKLQELHLNNNKISVINNRTFQGLKTLTVLNLRENFLEELSKGLFAVIPQLEELNLGQNRISRIDPQAFDGLVSLRVLYLDDNLLSTVPTSSLSLLGSLAELHVGLNAFTYLPDDSFEGLDKLAILDVRGAGLFNISDNAFRGLTGLRSLNLADNRLRIVPTKQLSDLGRLEDLTIGQNDFVAIEEESFKGLANLRKLDITGATHLQTIERGAFRDNMNLETIILSNNRKLDTIEEGALGGLPNLRHLVMKENAFTTLSESMLSWNELRVLELSDNPLHCSCNLLWLVNLLLHRNLSTVHCTTPSPLREKSLKILGPDELGCSFTDTRQQAILGALVIGGAGVLIILSILLYRYRKNVREALKDYKWNKRAISRKEHEYQKTFSDDDYIVRATQQNIKPIPVTEL